MLVDHHQGVGPRRDDPLCGFANAPQDQRQSPRDRREPDDRQIIDRKWARHSFRRHGVTSKQNVEGLVTKPENEHAPGTEVFWPRQAFYDLMACVAVCWGRPVF